MLFGFMLLVDLELDSLVICFLIEFIKLLLLILLELDELVVSVVVVL